MNPLAGFRKVHASDTAVLWAPYLAARAAAGGPPLAHLASVWLATSRGYYTGLVAGCLVVVRRSKVFQTYVAEVVAPPMSLSGDADLEQGVLAQLREAGLSAQLSPFDAQRLGQVVGGDPLVREVVFSPREWVGLEGPAWRTWRHKRARLLARGDCTVGPVTADQLDALVDRWVEQGRDHSKGQVPPLAGSSDHFGLWAGDTLVAASIHQAQGPGQVYVAAGPVDYQASREHLGGEAARILHLVDMRRIAERHGLDAQVSIGGTPASAGRGLASFKASLRGATEVPVYRLGDVNIDPAVWAGLNPKEAPMAAPTPTPKQAPPSAAPTHGLAVMSMALHEMKQDPTNPRAHSARNIEAIAASLRTHGQVSPLVVQKGTGVIVAGNGTHLAMAHLGWTHADVVEVDVDDHARKRLSVALNRTAELASWEDEALEAILRECMDAGSGLDGLGFTEGEAAAWLDEVQQGSRYADPVKETLAERFGAPPFSVLDSRQGYWQARKRWWRDQPGVRPSLGKDFLGSTSSSPDLDRSAGLKQEHGGSSFDGTLCELMLRWFMPEGGQVLDPFAGATVRGAVAAHLGYHYTGIDLRAVQVDANCEAWRAAGLSRPGLVGDTSQPEVTPVEHYPHEGDSVHKGGLGVWLKRDDLYTVAGVRGGKARTCFALCQAAAERGVGVVTGGSADSPQVALVARIAQHLGIPCRVHTPGGPPGPQVREALWAGAVRVAQFPRASNLAAKAREDAKRLGWQEVPFGMQCQAAVEQTRGQVANLPQEAQRLVVVVGSGMTLAGVLHGLRDAGRDMPVVGVVVGASPTKRLDRYAPDDWRDMVTLVDAEAAYDTHVDASIGGVPLDPHYEAKVLPFVQPGDCVWLVGHRNEVGPVPVADPTWLCGDAAGVLEGCAPESFDGLLTCPPYGPLERYSDLEQDLSTMDRQGFRLAIHHVLAASYRVLRPGSFAVWVVGDYRLRDGQLSGFPGWLMGKAQDVGFQLYNTAVLVTPAGSMPLRAANAFKKARKLARGHQEVVVLWKGPGKPEESLGWVPADSLADQEPGVDDA